MLVSDQVSWKIIAIETSKTLNTLPLEIYLQILGISKTLNQWNFWNN